MSNISPRWFHAAAAVSTTVYFTGGTTHDTSGNSIILDDTLSLDLSQPWTTDNPLLAKLGGMTAPLSGHSMNTVQGTSQLLVAGGESSSPQPPPILIYQTSGGGSWSAPSLSVNDTASFHRLYHASLTTGKDGALLQGGYQATANGTVISSLVTLKATNNFKPLSTTPVALAPSAPALARHTMTLTTDGQAVILGGVNSQGVVANLSIAYVLDTQANNGEWRSVQLQGNPPDPRMSFSTVLVNSTTMLVFGGTADFKSAFATPFYLDLPSWSWSSPSAQGDAPNRWGHTATMAGSLMVVAFVFIVGGAFHLLIRRRKKRTRNTLARENLSDQTPRSAVKRQASSELGFFGRLGSLLGFGTKNNSSGSNRSSKRCSEMPMYSNPMAISSRMTQMGYSPVSLGYPETVVQHGCGQVSVSSYIYPNQACVETEKEPDGQETLVVYHMLTQAQQEALKLSKQPAPNKNKLYQLDS
ncbi:hypothetical protein BGX26_009942 [Mortierella sp. AD094]|nr:hypothetical protein BGX26_009942 [Mortierella sp. AD094]